MEITPPDSAGGWQEVKSKKKGNTGSDEYSACRKTADEWFSKARSIKEEIDSALHHGNSQHARSLLFKLKHYRKLGREANSAASRQIFRSQNKRFDNNLTIDLHGQHPNEAVPKLKEHLQAQSIIPDTVQKLTVITGRGSHSLNGPKIKKAVKEHLDERNIPFEEVNGGCIVIKSIDACKYSEVADDENPGTEDQMEEWMEDLMTERIKELDLGSEEVKDIISGAGAQLCKGMTIFPRVPQRPG